MVSNPRASSIAELLLGREPPPPLTPHAIYDPSLTAQVDALDLPAMGKAALHLLNDDIDRGHALAQASEGEPTADYLHALVHRREGDFGNCKYWLGRAKAHPVLARIFGDEAGAIAFVDRCQAAGKGPSRELEEIQHRELSALFEEASRAG
jgi:hypothetical protein